MGNFYKDLRVGKTVEEEVLFILQNKYRGYFYDFFYDKKDKEKGYDLKAKVDILDEPIDVFFEVKYDRISDKSNFVAIEFECNNKKSGIVTTTSNFYVYKLNANFYIISVKKLKALIKTGKEFFHDIKYGGDKQMSRFIRVEKNKFISVCDKINT